VKDEDEFKDLANILKDTLQRLNRALDRPPYNFVIHTAPVIEGELEYYHWHLEIMPVLTRVAGFEIGSGFHINPTPPEDAAQYLREIAVED
jgi:UDPglucose--hexose-1-phosphate uridylyltransferase